MLPDSLQDQYQHLVEVDHQPHGRRYEGSLPDGRPVSVTTIAPTLAAEIRDPARFYETLERCARIRHHAIAAPLHWGATRQVIHVAYPRLAKADGAEQLLVAPAAVAQQGRDVLRGLDLVHATGLVHGALTPSRVVRTARGLVLDELGVLAALVTGGVPVREAVSVMSEVPYLSPEQVTGGVPDERSDVYSLGAVLYEFLTGKAPFGGRTTTYVLASVLTDEPDAEGPATVQNAVVDAVLRAIEREPDDRWPTAAAFAQALSEGVPRA